MAQSNLEMEKINRAQKTERTQNSHAQRIAADTMTSPRSANKKFLA